MSGVSPLFVALGTVLAACIAAAVARGVALANLRQAWINSLRDDLAEFFSLSDKMQRMEVEVWAKVQGFTVSRTGGPPRPLKEDEERMAMETLERMELISKRIALRLNPNEARHNRLYLLLSKMRDYKSGVKPESVLLVAKEILKREWQVTKWGMAEPLVRYSKDGCKILWASLVFAWEAVCAL